MFTLKNLARKGLISNLLCSSLCDEKAIWFIDILSLILVCLEVYHSVEYFMLDATMLKNVYVQWSDNI